MSKSGNISITFLTGLIYSLVVFEVNDGPLWATFLAAPIFGLVLSVIPNFFVKNWTKSWMWTTIIVSILSALGQLNMA